jgi:hypothetical protein
MSEVKSKSIAESLEESAAKTNIFIYNERAKEQWKLYLKPVTVPDRWSSIPSRMFAYCRENKQAYLMSSDNESIYFMMTSGAQTRGRIGFYKFAVARNKCSRIHTITGVYRTPSLNPAASDTLVNFSMEVYIINKENDISYISHKPGKTKRLCDTISSEIVIQSNGTNTVSEILTGYFRNIHIPAQRETSSANLDSLPHIA